MDGPAADPSITGSQNPAPTPPLISHAISNRIRYVNTLFDKVNQRASRVNQKHVRAYISLRRTRLCKVTPVILHGVVSPDRGSIKVAIGSIVRALPDSCAYANQVFNKAS